MVTIDPIRVQLGKYLREVRGRRFRFGSALAEQLGWQQSKVSKIETGRQLPSADDVQVWLEACGRTRLDDERVADLLARARVEDRSFLDLWKSGEIAADQRAIGEIERRARIISEYAPSLVPALVQTAAYARAVLGIPGGPVLLREPEGAEAAVEEHVAERMQRQQLLYMPGKRVRLLVGESALYVRFGSPDAAAAILAGQLDRLLTLFGLPSIELGVLPFAVPSPVLPIASVSLWDDGTSRVAWTETLTTEREVYELSHVDIYLRAFEIGMRSAARGDDAVDLIRRAARTL